MGEIEGALTEEQEPVKAAHHASKSIITAVISLRVTTLL